MPLYPLMLAPMAIAAPRAVALPATGAPETRDGVHVVAGGWRAEIHDGVVTWADTGFLGVISGYTATPTGWLFVDSLGVVATSRTFLGEPRRLPPLPDRLHAVVAGEGVLTVADAAGRYWWSTGGAMRPLTHPAGALLSAAFLDPQHGAAIVEGGALWTTSDGAVTWSPVDTQDTLAAATTTLTALTPDQLAALQPGLQARRPPAPSLRTGPEAPGARPCDPKGIPLMRERCVTPDGGATWHELNPQSPYCSYEDITGDRAIAWTCAGHQWAVLDLSTGAATEIAWPEAPPELWQVQQSRQFGETLVFVIEEYDYPEGSARGLSGGSLGPPTGRFPKVMDRDDPPPSPDDPVLSLTVAIGTPDHLELRPLPAGARAANFMSATQGFAAGSDGSQLWWTRDGGETWRPLRLRVDGDPSAVVLAPGRLGELSVWCDGPTCAVGDPDWGDFPTDSELAPPYVPRHAPVYLLLGDGLSAHTLAPEAPVPLSRYWDAPPLTPGMPEFVCEEGATRGSALPPLALGLERFPITGAGIDAALDVDAATGLGTVRWMDGATERRSQPIAVDAALLRTPRHDLVAQGQTGHALLFTESKGLESPRHRPGGDRVDAWWWVVDGRAPSISAKPSYEYVGPALTDPDGGLWINLLPITVPWPRPSDSRTVHTLRFGAEATETTQTRVGLASSPFTPLIGWSGGPVLARPAGTEILPFETLSLRGTGRTRVGAPGDLNVCQGPPGDNTFYLPVSSFMPAWAQTAYARLEVTDEGACVRGLEQGRGREQVVVTAENGALVGWNGEGVEISCRVRGD